MLQCPVRDCREALVRDNRRLVCSRGHSFDVARSGYTNLLQPQDKKSKNPGDSAEAVAARRRLHDLGVSGPLLTAIEEMVGLETRDVVLDAGCGDGFYLGQLAERSGCEAHGVDLSIPAIDTAAKKYPRCEWLVVNADRALPFADASFSVLLSITARMNSSEFARVLTKDGRMLVAIPGPEDLIELRGVGRERVDRTVETFAGDFRLVQQRRATHTVELDAAAVEDILLAIYRPMQQTAAVASKVTFSLDLLLFEPRGVML